MFEKLGEKKRMFAFLTLLVYFSHVLADNGQEEGRYSACEFEINKAFWTPFFETIFLGLFH